MRPCSGGPAMYSPKSKCCRSGVINNARVSDNADAEGVLENVDNTIQGRGQIGGNNLQVINSVDGVIKANDSTGISARPDVDPAFVGIAHCRCYIRVPAI